MLYVNKRTWLLILFLNCTDKKKFVSFVLIIMPTIVIDQCGKGELIGDNEQISIKENIKERTTTTWNGKI